MEPLESDPFAESFADHRWQGHELYSSATHYYLACALGASDSMVGMTADLAALWVFLTPPGEVLNLEARLRRNPDGVFRDVFTWINEEEIMPGSEKMVEAQTAVARILAEITGAREEIDLDSLEGGDAEGMPGKSDAGPDIALASPVFSDSTQSTS